MAVKVESGSRGAGGSGYWNPNGVIRRDTRLPDGRYIDTDPHAMAEHHLDRNGITYGMLNLASFTFAVTPESDWGAAIASATNDTIIEDWLPVDPRYRVSMLVSPVDPVLAAKEIRRVGRTPGVVQVLMPSATPMALGRRFFDPIYEAASELGLPVAVHPGFEGVGVSCRQRQSANRAAISNGTHRSPAPSRRIWSACLPRNLPAAPGPQVRPCRRWCGMVANVVMAS